MYYLAVTLYEFGQFLQILLWVSLPMVVIAMLTTTYVHYRKKRKQKEQEELEANFDDEAMPAILAKIPTEVALGEGGTAYQGLLWMKNKYEQHRDQTTAKYMQLKEEYKQLQEKFEDLQERQKDMQERQKEKTSQTSGPVTEETNQSSSGAVEAIVRESSGGTDAEQLQAAPVENNELEHMQQALAAAQEENRILREELIEIESCRDQLEEKKLQVGFLQNQLDHRIRSFHQLERQGREGKEQLAEWESRNLQTQALLNERQARIDGLEEQLRQETQRTAELKAKLESGGLLLLKIQKVLDQLLSGEGLLFSADKALQSPDNMDFEVTRISTWIESDSTEDKLEPVV